MNLSSSSVLSQYLVAKCGIFVYRSHPRESLSFDDRRLHQATSSQLLPRLHGQRKFDFFMGGMYTYIER